MKKKALLLLAVVVLTLVAAACTHHTCPAYRGSVVMANPPQNMQMFWGGLLCL